MFVFIIHHSSDLTFCIQTKWKSRRNESDYDKDINIECKEVMEIEEDTELGQVAVYTKEKHAFSFEKQSDWIKIDFYATHNNLPALNQVFIYKSQE